MENNITCKTCNEPATNNYCCNCGEQLKPPRISMKNFIGDALSDTISLEAPLLYTTQQLILNPGQVALKYVNGNRKIFTRPLAFFLFIIGTNFILSKWLIDPEALMLHINEGLMQSLAVVPEQNQEQFLDSVRLASKAQDYMKEMNFMMVPFLSFFSWLFFRKSNHNFLENIVLFFYTLGIITFFSIFSTLLASVSYSTMTYTGPIINILNFVFVIWAQVQFHQQVNLKGILKALAVYLLALTIMGMIAAMLVFSIGASL